MSGSSMEKYNIPIISASTIKREPLVSVIQSLSSRGILFVNAPAGYGKTTAAVQWLGARKYKAAWFSLDEYDSAVSDFYRGVLMGILSCAADSDNAELIRSVINDKAFNAYPLQHTLALFSQLNFDRDPSVIVIDDFHLCRDSSVISSLPVLRSRLPSRVRFVILSRNPPDVLLNDYILKGLLKQITFEELQFTKSEVSALFSKAGAALADSDVQRIQKQTLGWPAALSAIILSRNQGNRSTFFSNNKISDHEYLYNYIKYQVYEFWDRETRSVLMKTAIGEFVDPALCRKLTGQEDAWAILVKLSQKTGLIMRYGSESYRYQKLLKDFLMSEFESDDTIDKNALYYNVALWYKENNNIPAALDMAVKSGDIPLAEDIARRHSFTYGRFNIGVESYAREVYNNVLNKLPREVIEKSPRLSLECWFAAHAMGELDRSKEWMEVMKTHISAGIVIQPQDMFRACLQFAADTEKDSMFVIRFLKEVTIKPEDILSFDFPDKKPVPAFTLTYNMPFYHKAQRDYCDIFPQLDEYLAESAKYLPQLLSPFYETLALLIEGGVCCEGHNMQRAQEAAWAAHKTTENSVPEIKFASLMLLCEIYWYQGNTAEVNSLRTKTEEMITRTNAFYLTANFNAYVTSLALYNGDILSASNWLSSKTDFEMGLLALFKSFQNLTTARALMVTGSLTKAMDLLDKIIGFSKEYRRITDLIEAGTLQAICFWRMKNQDSAVKSLIEAIITAGKYQLPMPVVKQGADIVPVLQKIMNRLKVGYDNEILDKAFVSMIFLNARVLGEQYGGLFSRAMGKPVKLSQKQTLILELLSQNLSYKEMSELTGTKISTTRDHVSKLYQKLGVNNASDALLKARELGILQV